ncbi:septum site-determining protein MinC [Moritella sp. F3]|uniref:septum site-determining protein MinC n=1 Tax=Moritella sp. F3 TaxID=2718882 RepID=UPI0018E12047|nr:septum site-determining protein MinC [Moritella sp. F3]GIC78810.1 putative septum site-determining protein MinC [Moritella sp. F1]GIC83571.1 putative septum site-determining protein MinC [Moritella sp. F3]
MAEQSIKFKGTSFTLSVIHIENDAAMANLHTFIADKVGQAPAFFKSAPVVVNVANLAEDIDFMTIQQVITQNGMNLVGIEGCQTAEQKLVVREAGLSVISNTAKNSVTKLVPAAQIKPEVQTVIVEKSVTKTVVHKGQIRSGQQIYAQDASLTILGNISAGAEVIADGSIHIYGALRGRAIAGAKGDDSAHIFCNKLDPELLSINGTYILSDAVQTEFLNKQTQINCINNKLEITKFD